MIRVKRAVRELDEIVNRIIRQRRASGEDTGDLLSMLMAARDEDGSGMTDRQLRDEILTFLLAGHETTAVSLSWTWYLLSQHPEVEQKLRQELSQVLGGRTPQLEDLPRLPYTDKVVKESMRLYPPAWSLARTVAKETRARRLPASRGSERGHEPMDPAPRSALLRTARAVQSRPLDCRRSPALPRFAYFPFGGGPRLCIGASFAMMEANLLLAAIAQRFQLRLVPGHPVAALPSITLRPRHGMRMSLCQKDELRRPSPERNSQSQSNQRKN